jgi:ubiquinone/menaquinone biosynthesis C-methylase UbiE
MQVQPDKFQLLDGVISDYLSKVNTLTDRWLLEQTLYTGPVRRTIFQYFPFSPHTRVLDAGTGFGALALEIAGQMPTTVFGVDFDESKLDVAAYLKNDLEQREYFYPGSDVQFHKQDLYSLSFEAEQFDFVISRFVYQHLDHPDLVTQQLYRVMRPGGIICLIDIDDQFSISYPDSGGALKKLEQAFAELQLKRGGDRYVGRKLSTFLHQAGFEVQATAIQPQAAHSVVQSTDAGHQFLLNRLSGVKDELIANNILSLREFEQYVGELGSQQDSVQFNANAQVVVIAKKP